MIFGNDGAAEAPAERTRASIPPSTKAIRILHFKSEMPLGITVLPAWELHRSPEGLSRRAASLLLCFGRGMSLTAASVGGDGGAGGIEGRRNGVPDAWTEFLAWFPDEAAIEQAVVTPPATYQQTVRPDLRADCG